MSDLLTYKLRSYPADEYLGCLIMSARMPAACMSNWVFETLCAHHGCEEGDVGLIEHEDHGDLLTVNGDPVARIARNNIA